MEFTRDGFIRVPVEPWMKAKAKAPRGHSPLAGSQVAYGRYVGALGEVIIEHVLRKYGMSYRHVANENFNGDFLVKYKTGGEERNVLVEVKTQLLTSDPRASHHVRVHTHDRQDVPNYFQKCDYYIWVHLKLAANAADDEDVEVAYILGWHVMTEFREYATLLKRGDWVRGHEMKHTALEMPIKDLFPPKAFFVSVRVDDDDEELLERVS